MASGIYNCFLTDLMVGDVDMDNTDTVKIALYDNSHSFTATDTVYTSTNELASTGGYTQDDKTLTTSVTGTTTVAFDAVDTEWTSATFSAYHAVIYNVTNTNSLVCSIDFGGVKTVTAGTFTIAWNASGIITLTEA